MKNLIVLDDEEGFKFLFQHNFKDLIDSTFEFTFHSNSKSALSQLESLEGQTVLVCDVFLIQENGLDFAHSVKKRFPEISIILMSGSDPGDTGFGFSPKPIDFNKLRQQVLDSFASM